MSDDAAPATWWRELPFALIAPAVALATRLPLAKYAEVVINGDGALVCLMARHHSEGRGPYYFYGQSYNGVLEALFAAPFMPGYDGAVTGMGIAQAILSALVLLVCYPLCHRVGGRWGAVLGLLPFAVGSMALLDSLCGHQHSYFALMIIGALIVWIGLPAVSDPRPGRLLVVGALLGLGLYNNPQVVSFFGPLFVMLFLRGALACAYAEGRLRQALGGMFWPAALAVLTLALSMLFCAYLSVQAPYGWPPVEIPGVSLERPYRYLKNLVLATVAVLVGLEILLSSVRGRMAQLAAVFVVGVLIGNTPNIAYKLNHPDPPRGTPTGIDLGKIPGHARDLVRWGGYSLFNSNNTPWIDKWPKPGMSVAQQRQAIVTGALTLYALQLALLACLVALYVQREALLGMLRGRAPTPTIGLAMTGQAMITLGLWMVFPRDDLYARYLLSLWVPYAVLLAAAYKLIEGRLGRFWATLPLVVLLTHHAVGWVENRQHMRDLWTGEGMGRVQVPEGVEKTDGPVGNQGLELRAVNRWLLDREITVGAANYWYGYRMSFISGERVVYRHWQRDAARGLPGQDELYQGYVEQFDKATRFGRVFNLTESFGEDADSRHFLQFQRLVRDGRQLILAQHVVKTARPDHFSFGDFWVYACAHRGSHHEPPAEPAGRAALRARIATALEGLAPAGSYARWWPLGERLAKDHGAVTRPWVYEQRDRRDLWLRKRGRPFPLREPGNPSWAGEPTAYVFVRGVPVDEAMRARALHLLERGEITRLALRDVDGAELWLVRWAETWKR